MTQLILQHNETPKQLAMTAAGNKGIIELLENPSKAQQVSVNLGRLNGHIIFETAYYAY